ncbi:tyrosine--tRNA ligase [Candidatus Pelagibacter communis]|uniref:Tyrosine--tRNA ligase n=1 Tax=Pelagibacter ubique (strain HTCC1062) TaxID=335992 RepID=SYY_PELUB|nr:MULTISPECIES: tyrosine--tRNA ligase [Pelagibacter]Q4FMN5.1 RecName: Full=Tyrosine--tRNA ligase; AltName: Full=Tyrosyl-tRNA synthetase; Short=TyrRS [Candidatus Pelagibacter ubique HTCC1062]AAZ21554.1 tyrosyl-tRNA synthetase [Candidatus Pelagibacter ubique HTCC1062]MDA8836362.1 tyrosine--tRNA ligase [Candidatus Pelagibacter bacterium]
MNKFLKEFKDRGFFYQCTGEENLSQLLDKEKIRAYIGFDCTAESLHVGSLLQIMCLRLLQKHGHQPIVLLGGGTTRIGDPSGKDKTRTILSEDEIEKNINNIEKILKNFLDDKDPETKPIFVNNYTWLKNLNYISFLRDVGKHFTINKMLSFDSVKIRLEREQSLSYMEFNYMILQAYDFLELNKKEKCMLQIGGSDQWGNIVNGVDLIKRYSNNHVYGLTTPLITLASGAKMGKTESGAVWLDKKFLSSYDYWQFWRNIDDRDVLKFLKIFTDINVDEIENIKDDNINELKILLANKATSMLHGEDEARKCQETAKQTFSENSLGDNLPTTQINKKMLDDNISILDLVILSKLESSKSEIRRLIKGNGIKINGQAISDEKFLITEDLFKSSLIKLSLGKKKHIKVELI